MKIKHYDETLGKWVIDGASNASDLELTNPGYLDENGNSISVNNGFTKVFNNLNKLNQNLAWVYLNGTNGGGSGGTTTEYTLEVANTTMYISGNSADINFIIKSGSAKKTFTVVATNSSTGKVLGTFSRYSLTNTSITLTGLSGTTIVELSAYDSSSNYVVPVTVTIIAGALSLKASVSPASLMYVGVATDLNPVSYSYTNNTGSNATFTLTLNGTIVYTESINKTRGTINLKLRDYVSTLTSPTQCNFVAVITINSMTSNSVTNIVNLIYGDSLIIITRDISTTTTDITTVSQGEQLSFSYLLGYGSNSTFTQFTLDYYIMGVDDTVIPDTPTGTMGNTIQKGIEKVFNIGTTNLSTNTQYKLYLKAYATDDNTINTNTTVYFKVTESDTSMIYASNHNNNLLAYFSRIGGSGFPTNTTGDWTYNIPTTGNFAVDQVLFDISKVSIKLNKVNGSSTGFIQNTDNNGTPAICLGGKSYGYIPEIATILSDKDLAYSALNTGFHFSITYKTSYSSDTSGVICGLGTFDNNGLVSGFEVRSEEVVCKIGSIEQIRVDLAQGKLITIDLDIQHLESSWFFKLYVDGIPSAVTEVTSVSSWLFGLPMYLGCRNNNGILSNYSNAYIYDIKIYQDSQQDCDVVQNMISATEQASLVNNAIDQTLDSTLRSKNFFTSGKCGLWNYTTYEYKAGTELYNYMVGLTATEGIAYPVLKLTESSANSLFETYSSHVFTEASKHIVEATKYPITISYTDATGTVDITQTINSDTSVSSAQGPQVTFQGTSTLSNVSKNYEIYMGWMDTNETIPRLFTPKDTWLPENRFTLKGDVMDSSHVNNVSIGEIINGEYSPFSATPPMTTADTTSEIKAKMKHTSEGFPVLLFITFASGVTKFMGIYNFNLGRYAFHNLGLKLLTSYTLEKPQAPSLVSTYTEKLSWTNTPNVYSMEIGENENTDGAFQQGDISVVKHMADDKYSFITNSTSTSYEHFQIFYEAMSNMVLSGKQIQKTQYDETTSKYVPINPVSYYVHDNATYTYNNCDKYLNWKNACAYFTIAIILGMVDSMCKNLTLRNWVNNVWYPCFYDMDTAFKLNNAGADTVKYFAHINQYNNVYNSGELTTTTVVENYKGSDQDYACYYNRIWEVLANMSKADSSETRDGIIETYQTLRTGLFADPDTFIDKYYAALTNKIGAIVYAYDYKIKYLVQSSTYDVITETVGDPVYDQLRYLHGNRTISVRNWFKKRLRFLDGVYGFDSSGNSALGTVESPITTYWNSNKAKGDSNSPLFGSTIAADSKMYFKYSTQGVSGGFWIDSYPIDAILLRPSGESTVALYANKYITQFSGLKDYNWTVLSSIAFPSLLKLDLHGLTNIETFTLSSSDIVRVQYIDFNNLKLVGSSVKSLELKKCSNLQYLDLSNSSFTAITLPESSVLETLNLSNLGITSLIIGKDSADSMTPNGQPFLQYINISGCDQTKVVYINNCESLVTLNVPASVTSVTILNCPNFQTLEIPYISINNSISNLTSISIENCPGLKTFNITGQNNQSLVVSLVGAYNLESLEISNTQCSIIFPNKNIFTSLKRLDMSNTSITHFWDDSILDLSNFPNLSYINAYNCNKLVEVKCTNDLTNPIELPSSAFGYCTSLRRIYGYYKLQGIETFRGCSSLFLNDLTTYSEQGTKQFLIGEGVTNIDFDLSLINTYFMFEGCASLSYNDFKYLMLRLTNKLTSLEGMFKNCSGISGDIWYDMFKYCPNVQSIKDTFNGTRLSGIFFSRSSSYDSGDYSTYGLLDFTSKLNNSESAFANTAIQWIDNNAFAPIGTVYSSLVSIDYMFQDCTSLQSCVDTRASNITSGNLSSKTFFTNLRNLSNVYPSGVFSGCQNINMTIDSYNGNTYLFHTYKQVTVKAISSSLYTGINLIGKIESNVFGGVSHSFTDPDTWYIPYFASIQYPFQYSGNNITVDLVDMGNMFASFNTQLLQASGVFVNVKCNLGKDIIPDNIFAGCTKLLNISNFFNGMLTLTNNGQVYQFPNSNLFKDCTSLQDISNLFKGCNNLKLNLVGEGFKNCKLTNVSGTFASSGVFGVIPYRLFFMIDSNNNISNTITNMSGLFSECWCLGYDSTRTIDVVSPILSGTARWTNHIITNPGNRVTYKLDIASMVPTYNYDNNNANSIGYNLGETSYDVWYLDGYGWEDAPSDAASVKTLLNTNYLSYDATQKLALQQQVENDRAEIGYQNYMIPTDYFRYCAPTCTLDGAMTDFNYLTNNRVLDAGTGLWQIKQTKEFDGLVGRIPCKLFESLINNTAFSGVFKNTNFCAFVNLQDNNGTFTRGIKYPPDLFKYNVNLQSISNIFTNTVIEVGVDINTDIFANNAYLTNVSGVWQDCLFDQRQYKSDGASTSYSQFNFIKLFKNNTKIINASGLFAVSNYTLADKRGLLLIESTLFSNSFKMQNISNMFYQCALMAGSVPTFKTSSYTVLNTVAGYLAGCTQSNITNSSDLDSSLKPSTWN